jgi:hypothetical protein
MEMTALQVRQVLTVTMVPQETMVRQVRQEQMEMTALQVQTASTDSPHTK